RCDGLRADSPPVGVRTGRPSARNRLVGGGSTRRDSHPTRRRPASGDLICSQPRLRRRLADTRGLRFAPAGRQPGQVHGDADVHSDRPVIAATSGAAALPVATPRPPSLAASPARVTLSGAESRTIRVTNSGGGAAFVDVAPAGFALDLRGRPKILRRTDAAALRLEVQPRRLALQPGEATTLTVSAVPPPHVRAGDHPALVLLTT